MGHGRPYGASRLYRRPLPLKRGGVPAVNRQPKTIAAGNLRQRGGRSAGAEDIFGDAFTKTGPVAAGHGIRQQRLPGGSSSHEGRLRPREYGDSRRGNSRLRPSVCGEHKRAGAFGVHGRSFHSSRGRSRGTHRTFEGTGISREKRSDAGAGSRRCGEGGGRCLRAVRILWPDYGSRRQGYGRAVSALKGSRVHGTFKERCGHVSDTGAGRSVSDGAGTGSACGERL